MRGRSLRCSPWRLLAALIVLPRTKLFRFLSVGPWTLMHAHLGQYPRPLTHPSTFLFVLALVRNSRPRTSLNRAPLSYCAPSPAMPAGRASSMPQITLKRQLATVVFHPRFLPGRATPGPADLVGSQLIHMR